MNKIICSLILILFVLTGCGSSLNKADQLVDVLNKGTTEISHAKNIEEIQKIEKNIQDQINSIVGNEDDFKPDEEESKKLEQALTDYYRAFGTKMRELTDMSDQQTQIQGQPAEIEDYEQPAE